MKNVLHSLFDRLAAGQTQQQNFREGIDNFGLLAGGRRDLTTVPIGG